MWSFSFSLIEQLECFCCLRVFITKLLDTISSFLPSSHWCTASFWSFFSSISSLCSCFRTSSTLASLMSRKLLSCKLVRKVICFFNWLIHTLQWSCTDVLNSWSGGMRRNYVQNQTIYLGEVSGYNFSGSLF